MQASVLQRRQVLKLGAALCAAPAVLHAGNTGRETLLFSSVADGDNKHWLVALALQGDTAGERFRQALPGRGHHVALSARHKVWVALARRPGNWLLVGDAGSGEVLQRIRLPVDRHLYGHGVFSANQDYFYTTESDYSDMEGDNGLVVEWEVVKHGSLVNLQRKREFSSGGIGPHELLLLPDGATLAVANGGLRTHPETGREILNAATMLPSLAYLDIHSGAITEQRYLPEEYHQASIRHLDANREGAVVLGMQFQGEPFLDVPLVATHRRGEELRLLAAPPMVQTRMQQYVGSVKFSSEGRFFAASCPRGNLVTFWDAASGEFMQTVAARDGCGLSPAGQGFFISSGTGRITRVNLPHDEPEDIALPAGWFGLWDNHLTQIEAGGAA